MKKSDLRKKINRNNNTVFDYWVSPSNVLETDICVDHIWAKNEGTASGVKIIELQSSASEKSVHSCDDEKDYFPLPNREILNTKKKDYNYNINASAREKRRQREREKHNFNIDENKSNYGYNDPDTIYTKCLVSGSGDVPKENVFYNQVKCFTILDNHLRDFSSSDEDFEVTDGKDFNNERCDQTRNEDDADIMTYDPDSDTETQTVWIYSFQNKRQLSENDYELVNIPSQDESINSSFEDRQPSIENGGRIPSPVPPLFVPRLILPSTPPLPTVTEITEPVRQSSANQTENPFKKEGIKENNWLVSEHTATKQEVKQVNKSTNIFHWMALSPREKRRRLRNVSPISLSSDLINRLPTLNEVSSQMEKTEEIKARNLIGTSLRDNEYDGCQCGDNITFKRDQSTLTEVYQQTTSPLSRQRTSTHERFSLVDSAKECVKTIRSNLASAKENQGKSTDDLHVEVGLQAPKDRGDQPHILKPKPRIKIKNRLDTRIISGPIENLDSNNWIYEEKLIKDDYIRTPQNAEGDSASDRIWIRNSALLKPAAWAEYEQVYEAQSIPSLHLSMNTDSIEGNRTLTRRLWKCFSCCKFFK